VHFLPEVLLSVTLTHPLFTRDLADTDYLTKCVDQVLMPLLLTRHHSADRAPSHPVLVCRPWCRGFAMPSCRASQGASPLEIHMSLTSAAANDVGVAPLPPDQSRHRWWILAIVCIAQLMVVLDASIVNIALPSAQHDLGFSNGNRQWVITAYALAFGSLLLLGGRIADLFGRKITFLVGLAGFAGASALGGAAHSFGMLVGARTAQGLFGALLAPAALSLLTTTFTDAKSARRRSASSAASPARAQPSACCWAAS